LAQLNQHSEETKKRCGGWNSTAGMMIYQRASLTHASTISDSIHDASACSIQHAQHIYNTEPVPLTTSQQSYSSSSSSSSSSSFSSKV
jgi:hypothetical protein